MATRLDLRTRARIRADQDSSTFPTDTQYNYLIDEAAKEVWYELVRAGWPLRWQSTTVTGAGSALTLIGVSGIAFIRGVYRLEGGTFHELSRIPEGERANLLSDSSGIATAYAIAVATNGYMVELLPIPRGGSYVVEYVSEFAGFTADNDVWHGPARSDELIVLKAAMKACRKEGNDQGARFLEGEYQYLLQCVQDLASWVMMRHGATIRDVGDPLGRPRMPGDFTVYGPDF
jgi:hypothetical protein